MVRYTDFSPAELVKVCAGSKDEAVWTEFVRRFQAVIAATVLRTVRQWSESSHSQLDDLVQETYLKLCEDNSRLLRSFRPRHEDSIYGYLKVVAANVVHDHFKSALAIKRGSGQTESITNPLQSEAQVTVIDSFGTVSQRIQLEKIDKVLTRRTNTRDLERNRTIFWLRHRQGFTADEIAAIPSLGLTTEGVESVLMRLTLMVRSHVTSAPPHREVKVLKRQNRSKRLGS